MTDLARPRVLLLGDATARPDGLERALVRGGFQITEAEFASLQRPAGPLPDIVLLTAPEPDQTLAAELDLLAPEPWHAVPRIVLLASEEPEAVVQALALGADDVLLAPVRFPELRARIEARLRAVEESRAVRGAARTRELALEAVPDLLVPDRPEAVLGLLVRRVGEVLRVPRASFVLASPGEPFGRVLAVWESPGVTDLQVDLADYPEIVEAVRSGRPVVVEDAASDPLLEPARRRWAERGAAVEVRNIAALPLRVEGGASGVLLLRARAGDEPLEATQVECAGIFLRAAARALELAPRGEPARDARAEAPATDPLTGCGSAEALDRRLREEFERARRYALSFSLVLLDVDRLHDFNERHGRAGGDRLLAELGGLLRRELRAPDFVARYGGDEFALVLPETDTEGARRTVARVRQRIAGHPFPDLAPPERPQLSAGIVTVPHSSVMQAEDLFALAEAALLRGKAQTEERIGTAESVAA